MDASADARDSARRDVPDVAPDVGRLEGGAANEGAAEATTGHDAAPDVAAEAGQDAAPDVTSEAMVPDGPITATSRHDLEIDRHTDRLLSRVETESQVAGPSRRAILTRAVSKVPPKVVLPVGVAARRSWGSSPR